MHGTFISENNIPCHLKWPGFKACQKGRSLWISGKAFRHKETYWKGGGDRSKSWRYIWDIGCIFSVICWIYIVLKCVCNISILDLFFVCFIVVQNICQRKYCMFIFWFLCLNCFLFLVPGAAPRRVEVEVLNSTALKVMWRSVTPGKQNGQIRGYQVHYVRVENGESRGLPLIKDVMLADAQV